MNIKQWNNLSNDDKFKIFQDYLHDKLSLTQDNLMGWLQWISVMMTEKTRKNLDIIQNKLRQLRDERYIHQLNELENLLQNLATLLDKKQPNPQQKEFQCEQDPTTPTYRCPRYSVRYYHKNCRCIIKVRTKYHGTIFCNTSFSRLKEWSTMIFDKFMSFYVSNMYYVLKLKLSIFPRDIQFPPLDNLDDWELVCEDDDHQLLSHPLLPHPRDFLTHKKSEGERFVDKAKFEYYMDTSLDTCRVVLTHSPSTIPKLLPATRNDEEVAVSKKETDSIQQSLYHENTKQHKSGNKKPKKLLSRILKETRKKKKTKHIRPPSRPDAYEHKFDINSKVNVYNAYYYDDLDYYYDDWEPICHDYDYFDDYDFNIGYDNY